MIKYFEKGFNFSQDGPGNRVVYHLQGCNMKCPWCSNPEGMGAGSVGTACADAQTLAKEIASCRPMFFSGGGVTFTGGECTLYGKELLELIGILRENGINTAIESNACTPFFAEIAEACDHVMCDFKSPLADRLRAVTGGDLRLIKENLKRVAGKKYLHIRIPLIHGFNDDRESLDGFAAFFAELSGISEDFDVELLPYHEYGKDKWKKTGREYAVENGFVSPQTVMEFTVALKNSGVKIIKS